MGVLILWILSLARIGMEVVKIAVNLNEYSKHEFKEGKEFVDISRQTSGFDMKGCAFCCRSLNLTFFSFFFFFFPVTESQCLLSEIGS